ncbi:hypothetical protein ACLOJK_039659 [Asimina triloba]
MAAADEEETLPAGQIWIAAEEEAGETEETVWKMQMGFFASDELMPDLKKMKLCYHGCQIFGQKLTELETEVLMVGFRLQALLKKKGLHVVFSMIHGSDLPSGHSSVMDSSAAALEKMKHKIEYSGGAQHLCTYNYDSWVGIPPKYYGSILPYHKTILDISVLVIIPPSTEAGRVVSPQLASELYIEISHPNSPSGRVVFHRKDPSTACFLSSTIALVFRFTHRIPVVLIVSSVSRFAHRILAAPTIALASKFAHQILAAPTIASTSESAHRTPLIVVVTSVS